MVTRPVANQFQYPEPLQPDTSVALCDFYRPFNAQLVALLKAATRAAAAKAAQAAAADGGYDDDDIDDDDDPPPTFWSREFLEGFHWQCTDGNRAVAMVGRPQ